VTTRANALLAEIHDRMRVVVQPEDEEVWLTRQITDVEEIEPVMEPLGSDEVVDYSAATAVNDAYRDGPELIRPHDPKQLRLARASWTGHSDEVVIERPVLHDGPTQVRIPPVADGLPDGVAGALIVRSNRLVDLVAGLRFGAAELAHNGRVAAVRPPIEGVVNSIHRSRSIVVFRV
jgi:SOS response associated peptidase (SRAP)